jgi:hypothetical protein
MFEIKFQALTFYGIIKYTSKTNLKAIIENVWESRKKWLLEQFNTTEGFRFWRAYN